MCGLKLWGWWRKKRACGLIPQDADERDYIYKVSGSLTPVFASAFNDSDEVTNQGSYNSCVAHATSVLINDEIRRIAPDFLPAWKNFLSSEAYLWYTTRALEGNENKNVGVVARDSFKAVKKYGFVSRSIWDYDDGPYNQPSLAVLELANAHLLLLQHFPAYYAIVGNLEEQFRDIISNGRKLKCAIPVYENFQEYKGGIISEASGSFIGYHDVVIGAYGYVDGETFFTGLNSWGPSWGEDGYFRISGEYLASIAFDAWTLKEVTQ